MHKIRAGALLSALAGIACAEAVYAQPGDSRSSEPGERREAGNTQARGELPKPTNADPARDDAPGRVQYFVLSNQPLPGREENRESKVVDRPRGAMPRVPEGFVVELIGEGLEQPRAVAVSSVGDIVVANSKADEVRVFRAGHQGPASKGEVFLSGLNRPFGIAFYPRDGVPEWVYIANTDSIVRVPYLTRDDSAKPQVLVDDLPTDHHWTKAIAFSPAGDRLVVGIGSGSNVAEDMDAEPDIDGGMSAWKSSKPLGALWDTEKGRAEIRLFDILGRDERVVATGLRNPAGIAFHPASDELWAVVNERDGMGDDMPYEYVTRVKDGGFYGWPWFYPGPFADTRVKSSRPDLKDRVITPDVFMQAHTAPLQMVFYDKTAFPSEYQGDAFIAMHGSWNRASFAGYKVVRLDFDGEGQPVGTYTDFMTGFIVSDTEVWGRPVGVAVAPDGSLIVTEDGSGTVWRVRYVGQPGARGEPNEPRGQTLPAPRD